MRLVDVDKLIEKWNELSVRGRTEFDQVIMIMPTAFDVEKVLKQLEKSHFHTDATFDDDGYCNDDSEEVVNLNEAIEIVRKGGIVG